MRGKTVALFFCGLVAMPADDAVINGRVVDGDTGRLIPCTVAIRTADGHVLTDHPSFRGGFRSPGEFEKRVPAGNVMVTVSRGFDYASEQQTAALRAGETRELVFQLRRRAPLRRLGWYCGDNHDHMIHGERRVSVDFPFVALSARAEGLDYLSVAQQWNLPEVSPEALDAACRRVSTDDFLLTWNMEAPKNYWRGDVSHCMGHGWTAGMRGRTPDGRDAIQELAAMSAWDYESDKTPTPNFESHLLIHSLGGIVSYTHPHRWWWGKWGGRGIYPAEDHKFVSNMAAELPYDTIVGPTFDTIDISMQPRETEVNKKAQELWFLLLNHGYRIAGTASSDATFDNPGGGVPGRVRVYTRVEGRLTPASLAEAMRRGRNFVTSGPLLRMTIAGHEIGDIIPAGATTLGVLEAWAATLSKIELIRNGKVIREYQPQGSHARFELEIREPETAWYVARCFGADDSEYAITNPIYFEAKSYQPRQPALAHVTGSVQDAATGQPLSGVVEIGGARRPFTNGKFVLTAPGTARLRVLTEGYAPLEKSVFVDYQPLLELTLGMRSEQLSDWRTFETIRELLSDVRLDFRLRR